METEAFERLRTFRQTIYTTFGCRRDALVEILDALLTTPIIEHPVHLSLAPASNEPGAASTMRSMLARCRCPGWSIWWQNSR